MVCALSIGACSSADTDESPRSSPPPLCKQDAAPKPATPCGFEAGALPSETLGACTIPIEHVIVLMQENRSFDHYLGRLGAFGHDDVDVPPDGASNPAATGPAVPFHHLDALCSDDTAHSWESSHLQWNMGKNDGFVVTNDPGGERAMGYYDERDLPFYYALASTFAIADRYHADVMGPTYPNRMYLYAGTSFGLDHNGAAPSGARSIFHVMNERGISWKVYREAEPNLLVFLDVAVSSASKLVDLGEFANDAANGTLPQVSWIDARPTGGALEDDEHPPGDVQVGQHLVWEQIDALTKSPSWSSSVLFLVYDEHGGFYDHVPPPEACPPDDLPPEEHPELGGFDRYGFRVPLYVVSPFARAHHVSHALHSHASILRFIEALFGLPAFTRRDANADAMLDLFDFENPPLMIPPELAEPPIDAAALEACKAKYPP